MDNPLEDMETANGQLDNELQQMRAFEDLFQTSKTSPFGTNDPRIFAENLDQMNYAQMQAMASRVGINAYIDAPRLKIALEKAFAAEKTHRSILNAPKPLTRGFDYSDPEQVKLAKSLGVVV